MPRPPVVTADFVLSSSAWSSQVVGHVSSWIQPDAEDAELRAKSEQALRTELSWAAHMSFQARVTASFRELRVAAAATWPWRL